MTTLRFIAIPTQIADYVRTYQKAPQYNHPAHSEIATGHGPCRHCLRVFQVGQEQRILFTYDPFDGVETLPLPGPVFIHANQCDRYREEAGFPPGLLAYPLVLNVYAHGPKLLDQIFAAPNEAEALIQEAFAEPAVDYIEVRDRQAGCFDFRVER